MGRNIWEEVEMMALMFRRKLKKKSCKFKETKHLVTAKAKKVDDNAQGGTSQLEEMNRGTKTVA